MSGDARNPVLAQRGTYAFWSEEKLRWQDVDRLDHVNNVAFSALAENARVEFLDAVVADPAARSGVLFVVASVTLQFHAEVHYPGRIEIGTGVSRIGGASVTLAQGLFSEGGCCVTSQSVIVLIDERSRRSVRLPEELRHCLAHYRTES